MKAAVLVLGSMGPARADYWQDQELQQRLEDQERQISQMKERQQMLQIENDFNAMEAARLRSEQTQNFLHSLNLYK